MPKPETIYLAYGSNLNLPQMAYRCPTARAVGSTTIHGYDLKFRGQDGRAVATVEPGEGAVPALLWKLAPKDEKALDHYEGWPHLYRKEAMTVEWNGKPIEAMVYIMNDGRDLGQPSQGYLNSIRKGYRDAGFDETVLDEAIERSMSPHAQARQQLRDILERNMDALHAGWLAMSPTDILMEVHEIAAAKMIYDELQECFFPPKVTDFLLASENPLELILDSWAEYGMSFPTEDIVEELVESLYDEHLAEQEHDSAFAPQQEMDW